MTSTAPETATGTTRSSSNVLSILAIVFGVVALLFLPILFGPIGIVCGAIALSKHERLAKVGLAVAIVGMLAGFAIGAAFMASA